MGVVRSGRVESNDARATAPPVFERKETRSPGNAPRSEFMHFHGRKSPGRLRLAAQDVMELAGADESRRVHAVRELALICVAEHGHPNEMYQRLVGVFRRNAESSPFDDVRRGSMDALYLCHELSLLKEIPLDGANAELLHHRDWLVNRLEERKERLH